jgi:hypothetical protein
MPTRDELEAEYFVLFTGGASTIEIARRYGVGKDSVRRHLRNYCVRNRLNWTQIHHNSLDGIRATRVRVLSSSKRLSEAADELGLSVKALNKWIYSRFERGDPVPHTLKDALLP